MHKQEVNPILKLTQLLEDTLPQTQCTKCGYPDCHSYALAMAQEEVAHNRCPPGGQEGVERLGNILERVSLPLDASCGIERPRSVALINPKECIGCTLCIKACPVDAIVGAAKQLHIVLSDRCTGCDLCIPPCPVDCIDMIPVTGDQTGWDAWTPEQSKIARTQYHARKNRLVREKLDNDRRLEIKAQEKLKTLESEVQTGNVEPNEAERKRAIIQAAIARAKVKLGR